MTSWTKTTIGEVATFRYGKSLAAEKRVPGEVPVYGSNGVVGWHSKALVDSPGIVIGRKGSVGAVHLAAGPFFPIDTTYFIPQPDIKLDLRFLYFKLLHLNLYRLVSDLVPGLNRDAAHSQEILVPPSGLEQRRIAAILTAVQRSIEQQERLAALTSELKRALTHKLFTEGTRGEAQKQTEIGPVPTSWVSTRLGDVCHFGTGGTPSRAKMEFWENGTIPWVKTTEVNYCTIADTEERITQAGLDSSAAKIFPKGTVLVAMYGQGVTRGRAAILGIDAATNQACAAIQPRDPDQITARFLYHYLEYHYETLRQRAHGAHQKNLNMALLKAFPTFYPKPTDQNEITTALEAVDVARRLHKKQQAVLMDLFRTLLHQLMTAQVRVDKVDLGELRAVGIRVD